MNVVENPAPRPQLSPLQRRFISFLILLGAVSLFWGLYKIGVSEPIDSPPQALSIPAGAKAPEVAVSLAANLNAPLLEGNRVTLLENGDEIFPAMLGSIRSARQSVNLLTYVYWEGEIAHTFANELSAAAKRGVRVRVLIDAFGGKSMDRAWVEMMRSAGCEVAWFRPLRWNMLDRVNNRTHRKALIIDGRVAYTGGVGIAQQWVGNAQDADHWRDDHFRLEGPVVRYIQGSFAENWHEASGTVLAGDDLFPSLAPIGNARAVPISTTPGDDFGGIPFTYWLLFRAAQREVLIATPYYVPDPDIGLGLIEAARRGVRVTLLIPGPHQESAVVRYASYTYYRELLEAGVRIFEYQPTVMHTKLVIVDGAWALIGSPNFDSRSIELNYENAVAVYDEAFAARLSESFAHDLTRSKEVAREDVERWGVFARARNALAALLREQL
ncbi:MAG: Cardiolipin synthetase [uncultured Lysobacter sp.]|uniref:Cardiolipin synthetase n=1 Tax=uncultured Lysobacter sp. TaxID=271060 RepID=A0A6J4LVB4_9GAMM|nr:MAG: Cardiolipin synthetase [uncultured Lysobacter sp.]